MLPTDNSYDILVRKAATFGHSQNSLPEAIGKTSELILLSEENSKQGSIDSEVWLLVVTLVEIYNEKEKAEQDKLQNLKLKGKKKKEHQKVECN